MKIFKINPTIVMIVVSMLQTVCILQASSGKQPSSTVPAYSNKIVEISYAVGSHNQHAITFTFEKAPICQYTPLTYQDLNNARLTQSYFLPRTEWKGLQKHYFYTELEQVLQKLGIELRIQDTNSIHYGLRLHFVMQPQRVYAITKVVDSQAKTVTFQFVPEY